MEKRLKQKTRQYADAVKDFENTLSIDLELYPENVADGLKSGRVQKFEVCIELLWKTLKSHLWEVNGIDARSPKIVVKEIFGLGDITPEEYEGVIEMLDDRNRLSHIYDKDQFEKIYSRVITRLPLFRRILNYIQSEYEKNRLDFNETEQRKHQVDR